MSVNIHKHKCIIDNITFTFGHVSPRALRKVFLDVMGKVLKSVSPKGDKLDFENMMDKDIASIIDISFLLQNISNVLNESEIESVESILFSACQATMNIDGEKKMMWVNDFYDVVFEDDFFRSFKLLKEAFVCYYSSFFSKAGNVISKSTFLNGIEKTKGGVSG